MEYMPFIWIAVIILTAIAEAFTAQMISIWFVLGAVAALIVSLIVPEVWVQVAVFIAITLLTLVLTRPIIKKASKFKKTKTNADRYIGKIGLVTVEINNELGLGQVNVSGSIWTAFSKNGEVLKIGENVMVDSIEGVKLVVFPINSIPQQK